MTEIITATTTLTNNRSIVLIQLSSGNLAMVDYTVSAGDVMIAVLLVVMMALQIVEIWRRR